MINRLVIICGPSGSGKTTIVQHLLSNNPKLKFSISATTRIKRENEQDGDDYYFLSTDEFKKKIEADEFLEWEQVYTDLYYGTLKSEVERISKEGNMVIFDIDVQGGLNLQKQFKEKSLAIFVMPPSVEDLKKRLQRRKTESAESLLTRISKAEQEIEHAFHFDHVLVNKDLDKSFATAQELLDEYLNEDVNDNRSD
ncbi:MAG: guanylate kinase [Bacteroidia bacterium]|nr:guanylate kinase [Bacteroidia bacterium]